MHIEDVTGSIVDVNQPLENYIYELIYNKLKFKHKLRGSSYLLFYIEKVIKENLSIFDYRATNDIYPLIASEFNTTPQKVERGIRHAIESSWSLIDNDVKQKVFSFNENRPTNLETIHTITNYIRRYYYIKNKIDETESIDNKQTINGFIIDVLYNKLKFKKSSLGGSYLLFYIEQVIKNKWIVYGCSPTKKIYPFIAAHFNTTQESVERSIRNIIDVSWNNIDDDVKKQIFPIIKNDRPTNTEVIYAITDYVKANVLNDEIENSILIVNGKERKISKEKLNYYLRFELQKMLEEIFHIYSKFGITKLQILVDAIMISLEMNGLTDNEMEYVISKISKMYGIEDSISELLLDNKEVDIVTKNLYKMCKQIYQVNPVEFPNPKNKTYIKSYLNILAKQVRNKYN